MKIKRQLEKRGVRLYAANATNKSDRREPSTDRIRRMTRKINARTPLLCDSDYVEMTTTC